MPVQTQMQVRRGTASSWTSTNPTLAAGELGFETDTGKFKIGTGSSTWNSLLYAGGGQSSLTTYQYTATAAQTTFSGTDANGNTLSYTVGAIQVYLNGALLQNTADYAATNGTSVVLTAGALAGDSLTILSLATFDVANTYTQAQADALFIADTIVDAKGDIIAATASDTVARLAVGANDTMLVADSTAATGLNWKTATEQYPWQVWTPTYTNMTIGNGTSVARYVKIGKTVHWYLKFTFGSTSSFGIYTAFTLPSTPISGFNYNARGLCRDAGVTWRFASAIIDTEVYPNVENVAGTYSVDVSISSTVPFTWGTGDFLQLAGTYEEA
jgi:hypothetical protein